jgi:hypothetical protein
MLDKKFKDNKTGKSFRIFYHYDGVIKAMPIDGSKTQAQFSQPFFEKLLNDKQLILFK